MHSVHAVQMGPVFFAKPDVDPIKLQVAPRLASWMTAEHPDKIRLEQFLDHSEAVLASPLSQLPDPLGLRLDVGLAAPVHLLAEHDLDNYALPLAMRLMKAPGRRLASMWVTKQYADASFVRVQQAVVRPGATVAGEWRHVRTSVSASTVAYKQQIHDQLHGVRPLPEGAVALEVSFTVGPRRNWLNLWKPTIDALDALLGSTTPGRRWHPRDGRIVELGLHQQVDASWGSDVAIAIAVAAGAR